MRVTQLEGWSARITKHAESNVVPLNGTTPGVVWQLELIENPQGPGQRPSEVIVFRFGDEVKDHLVRALTGVVLPQG